MTLSRAHIDTDESPLEHPIAYVHIVSLLDYNQLHSYNNPYVEDYTGMVRWLQEESSKVAGHDSTLHRRPCWKPIQHAIIISNNSSTMTEQMQRLLEAIRSIFGRHVQVLSIGKQEPIDPKLQKALSDFGMRVVTPFLTNYSAITDAPVKSPKKLFSTIYTFFILFTRM